jgi:hypothetical protein
MGMTTSEVAPGRVPVLQLAAVFQFPVDGPIQVTVEAVLYVNVEPDEVPPGPMTVTLAVPPIMALGAVARIVVEFSTVKLAVIMPNETDVAPRKFVPVMTTGTPPEAVSLLGLSDEIVGVPW